MDRTRRHLIIAAASLAPAALLSNAMAAPQKDSGLSMLEAINQAGRQRMLSQRMAKCYAQQLLGVKVDQAQQLLAASATRFDEQLANLRRFTAAKDRAEAAATYEKLAALWGGQEGSLLELTVRGKEPLTIAETGETRTFLEDGDTLTLTGYCQGEGYRVGFGQCLGQVSPAV